MSGISTVSSRAKEAIADTQMEHTRSSSLICDGYEHADSVGAFSPSSPRPLGLDTAIFQINKSNQLPLRKENEATVHSAAWYLQVQHTEALGQKFDLEKLTGPLLIEGHHEESQTGDIFLVYLTSTARR
jgi:hypothetical protein